MFSVFACVVVFPSFFNFHTTLCRSSLLLIVVFKFHTFVVPRDRTKNRENFLFSFCGCFFFFCIVGGIVFHHHHQSLRTPHIKREVSPSSHTHHTTQHTFTHSFSFGLYHKKDKKILNKTTQSHQTRKKKDKINMTQVTKKRYAKPLLF